MATTVSFYNNDLWAREYNRKKVILDKISQLLTVFKCFNHKKKLVLVSISLKQLKRNTK